MFVPKTLMNSQNGQLQDFRNNHVQSQSHLQLDMVGQHHQDFVSHQPPLQNVITNQSNQVQSYPQLISTHEAWRHMQSYQTQSPGTALQRLPEYVQTLPPEKQVQQAVQAVDHTIATAQNERNLAMQIAADEMRKRMEAQERLKRMQEEQEKLKDVLKGGQFESMFSPSMALALDDMFSELDKCLGIDLNFTNTEENLDYEKISKAGHSYVDRISRAVEPLGDISHLSDAEFVDARYRYLTGSK